MSLTKTSFSMINGACGNVLDYGADPTGATTSTSAFTAALAANSRVYVPSGTYAIDDTIVIPEFKTIFGDGPFATTIEATLSTGKAAFQLGASTSALNYYEGLQGLLILLKSNNTTGVLLYGTCGATVNDINVQEDGGTSCSGFVIDGGNQSAFFNILQNCYALHCTNFGYRIYSTGSSYATINHFIDCSVFGDNAATGFEFDGSNGTNSVVLGGNAENCAVGLNLISSTGITFNALRFEANTYDLNFNAFVTQCNFIGVQNIVTTNGIDWQNGYGKNTFLGCSGTYGIVNRQEATNFIYSKAANQIPLTIQGYASQSSNLVEWKNNTGTLISAITSSGALKLIGGAPTVSVGEVAIGGTTATTVGTAGGASALPATPLGYIIGNVGGTIVKIPYYNA